MARVTLHGIVLGRIAKGGYVISYEGAIGADARLRLGLPDLAHSMDVTGENSKDLLTSKNLPLFLSLIGRQNKWGQRIACRLFVMRGDLVVSQSDEVQFDAPVRPYCGPLRPELGRRDAGPPLRYTGVQDGRMLYMPAIDGCYYFAYGGKFETSNAKRGLNCITYVGAVLGVSPSSNAMSEYGTRLANYCGCVPCELENKTLPEIKAAFNNGRAGTYVMWSEHHTVLVVNRWVHEFRQLRGGYQHVPIAQWDHRDTRWWVRRSPKQF
jgi:hypothetical protein